MSTSAKPVNQSAKMEAPVSTLWEVTAVVALQVTMVSTVRHHHVIVAIVMRLRRNISYTLMVHTIVIITITLVLKNGVKIIQNV